MNSDKKTKAPVSYTPCPPEEFAGREKEKKKLLEILEGVKDQGQVIMVSGARGSGKSSFLNWAQYEIENKPGDSKSPAVKKKFLETPGMIFTTYKSE
jgi:predicted NACHT family NTPase